MNFPSKPRRRKRNIMLDTDADAAEIVTFETETYTTKGGRTKTKRIKVALNPQNVPAGPSNDEAGPSSQPVDSVSNDMDMEPGPDAVPCAEPKERKVRVVHKYMW
jgi:hypothetical protein